MKILEFFGKDSNKIEEILMIFSLIHRETKKGQKVKLKDNLFINLEEILGNVLAYKGRNVLAVLRFLCIFEVEVSVKCKELIKEITRNI